MQQITISGNLVADAQVHTRKDSTTGASSEFITFKVACNTNSGEVKETTFYDVTYRKTRVFEFLKKGQSVLVNGQLKASLFTKDDGKAFLNLQIYNTSVVELTGKRPAE